jgi:hypothetical protein
VSGIVVFSTDREWFRANWLYQAVLSEVLRYSPPGFVGSQLTASIEPNLKYLDLTSWSREHVQQLLKAAQDAYRTSELASPDSFHDPTFYPMFLESFRALLHDLEWLLDQLPESTASP